MNRDEWFYSMAEAVSKMSPCLSRQIGCIAVRDKKFIVAMGYNGPPSGYPHCSLAVIKSPTTFTTVDNKIEGFVTLKSNQTFEKICPRRVKGYKSGEGLEECPAEHAERNVICEAARIGISLQGCSLYMNCEIPCRECAKAIVNAGITEIHTFGKQIYPEPGITGLEVFLKCGIKIYPKDA